MKTHSRSNSVKALARSGFIACPAHSHPCPVSGRSLLGFMVLAVTTLFLCPANKQHHSEYCRTRFSGPAKYSTTAALQSCRRCELALHRTKGTLTGTRLTFALISAATILAEHC
ncbi:hypothetical protein Pelo_16573 [Pelomyxa schiedti]|nr:hypothetical protein Pelo_16573 [Pelomyxa schiedti]